jgi:hypothetical protein
MNEAFKQIYQPCRKERERERKRETERERDQTRARDSGRTDDRQTDQTRRDRTGRGRTGQDSTRQGKARKAKTDRERDIIVGGRERMAEQRERGREAADADQCHTSALLVPYSVPYLVPYPVPYPICIAKTRKTISEATILNIVFVKLTLKAICIVKNR